MIGVVGLRRSLLGLNSGIHLLKHPSLGHQPTLWSTVNQLRLASSPSSFSPNGPSKPSSSSKRVSVQRNTTISSENSGSAPKTANQPITEGTSTSDRPEGNQSSTLEVKSSIKITPSPPVDQILEPDATSSSKLPAETSSSSFASQMLDLASDVPPPPPPNDRTGAKSKLTGKRHLSSADKQRQLISRILAAIIVSFGGLWVWDQGRPWANEDEKRILGGGEDGDRLSRILARLYDLFDYFNKPAWNPLLPAPLPEPHGRPFTLLVDLEGLLVHSGWSREHGWRTAKRPGADYFLSYLSQLYEIVIFTTQPAYTAAPICEKLDPFGYFAPYKLFKESCRSKGIIKPQLIKDLDYLGRDLRKVVYIETDPSLVQMHPLNGFVIPKWDGNPNDTGLVDLIPLLEAIVFNSVNDVRDVTRAYQGRNPIKAYAESEARQKKELLDKWEKDRDSRKAGWNIDLRAIFGLSSHNPDEPPKLLVEKDRARAQQAYLDEQKYWKENEATFKKLMEEDREKQMAEMKGSLLGFLTGQVGGPPPPSNTSSSTQS